MYFVNLEIIELIYDVPLGQSNWHDVLEALRKELEAKMALLFLAQKNAPPILITTSIPDDQKWAEYIEYFNTIDPWNEILISGQKPINHIHYGRDYIPEKTFKSTEYYADFWSKMKLGETIGGQMMTKNGISVQIGLPRHHDQSNYEMSHTLLLRSYCKHILKAIELEGYLGHSLPQGIYENGLMARFGLTAAEARLVLQLIKSDSLKQASIAMNKSYHTTQTQLKSIYKKTKTHSQIELLKKLMTL